MNRLISAFAALVLSAFALAACNPAQAEIGHLKDRARIAQACKDSGGQWYNTPGWGEACNYDTRNKP